MSSFLFVCVVWLFTIEVVVLEEFRNLQNEFGKWKLKTYPEFATSEGIDDHNDKLQSLSPDEFDQLKVKSDRFMTQLRRLAYEEMPNETQVDYDILEQTIRTFQDGYQWRQYGALNTVSFLDGPADIPEKLLEATPFYNKGDYINFLERLKAFPRMIDEHVQRMKMAVLHNRTHHEVSMKKVREQVKDVLTSRPEHFILYRPFNETLNDITTITGTEKNSYRNSAKASIRRIREAYNDMVMYIESVYKKRLREGLGVCSWQHGREFYKAALKWHISIDMTPRQVNDLGIREVLRINQKIKRILMRQGFRGTLREFTTYIKTNRSFTLSDQRSVIRKYEDIIQNQIKPKLPMLFKDLPDFPLRVTQSQTDGTFAEYQIGSENGMEPGMFYLNLFRPSDVSTPNFMSLALHETYPGRHLQRSIQRLSRLPLFRQHNQDKNTYFQVPFQLPDYSVFSEGWALYAETLGDTMKLYRDDFSLLGRYSSELFRAAQLVVDTGIHYYNWSKDRAVDYLMGNSMFGLDLLENVVDMMTTWPGHACGAKIGEMKIMELRRRAQRTLGPKYDIREFHAEILRHGDVPLDVAERIIDNWITRRSRQSTCGAAASLSHTSVFRFVITILVLCLII